MSEDDPSGNLRCSSCGSRHPDGLACSAHEGRWIGTVLEGKYDIVRLLGSGGMGEVYEGWHRGVEKRVAVKFLRAEYRNNPDVAIRFANEAKAPNRGEHENLVAVHDVNEHPDGTPYLIMEFLDGEDVEKVLRRSGPFPPSRAAAIVVQACRGLGGVHARGIVHRDLKPSNLFLTKRTDNTDRVKVLDFGIAKFGEGNAASVTKTGRAVGTASYMSPEQARGEETLDARSDLYALGAILYELLAGKKAHDGGSFQKTLYKVATEPPLSLESVCPGLPFALYGVVRRAMAPLPADRYASAADLAQALLPFIDPGPATLPAQPEDGSAESDETRDSEISTADAHANAAPSIVGVTRSKPGLADEGGAPAAKHRSWRLGGLFVVGIPVIALTAIAFVHRAAPRSPPSAVPAASPLTALPTASVAQAAATIPEPSIASPRATTGPAAAPPTERSPRVFERSSQVFERSVATPIPPATPAIPHEPLPAIDASAMTGPASAASSASDVAPRKPPAETRETRGMNPF